MISTIQTKYSFFVPEFSHFPLTLVFQILPALDAPRREAGATATVKRAFSWLSVPVWVKGSRKRQLLPWVFIHHSSVPHFSSLKMPLNCHIFSYFCAVENLRVSVLAEGIHGLYLPLRSAQQHHCGPSVFHGTFWMMISTPVDFGMDLRAASVPCPFCAGA